MRGRGRLVVEGGDWSWVRNGRRLFERRICSSSWVEWERNRVDVSSRYGPHLLPLPPHLQSRTVPRARRGDGGDGGREDDTPEGGRAVGRGGHCGWLMVVDASVQEGGG